MKRAILEISDQYLVAILQMLIDPNRIYRVLRNPLPDDVKPIRAFQTKHDGVLGIVVESESFEDIKQGERYPTLPLIEFGVRFHLVDDVECKKEAISDYEP